MVAKVMKTVSETENKSELELLDDLETVAVGDVIGVRTFDPCDIQEHTLPLSDAVSLLTRARLLALAGAASAIKALPVHPRKPTSEASRFVENLRLGQTERGSYRIRLISPIAQPTKLNGEQFDGMPDAQPFSRRACD